ncbi:MAG: FAD-dependent oxidoreductase [Actinomycetota bacterium]|nr:FAD-dependent oxidoreductase [Actinomycetota bacterium]
MSVEVIVIGAGYGGLTTSAILSHDGVEVELLESTGHLGGRATYDRKDGFLVDYGLHEHPYGRHGEAAAAFREIGHEIDFIRPGRTQIYVEGEFEPMTASVSSAPSTFLKNKPLSFYDKYLISRSVRKIFRKKDERLAELSIAQMIGGTKRENVREFLRLLSNFTLAATDIETASALELKKWFRRMIKAKGNTLFPRSGTSQIIETLASKTKETGKISLNSRVKAIQFEGNKAKSVQVKDKTLEAKAFVFAVPVQKLPELVSESLESDYLNSCTSIIPTSGISLDLCLDRVLSEIDGIILSVDPMTMGQFTSNIDPECAPAGKQLATFFMPLPYSLITKNKEIESEKKRFLELIESMFPGIFEHVLWERLLVLKMVDGFEPRVGQTEEERPKTRVPGVENLFLSGDTVGVPGKGGDVAFRSGVEAAKAVLDYLR